MTKLGCVLLLCLVACLNAAILPIRPQNYVITWETESSVNSGQPRHGFNEIKFESMQLTNDLLQLKIAADSLIHRLDIQSGRWNQQIRPQADRIALLNHMINFLEVRTRQLEKRIDHQQINVPEAAKSLRQTMSKLEQIRQQCRQENDEQQMTDDVMVQHLQELMDIFRNLARDTKMTVKFEDQQEREMQKIMNACVEDIQQGNVQSATKKFKRLSDEKVRGVIRKALKSRQSNFDTILEIGNQMDNQRLCFVLLNQLWSETNVAGLQTAETDSRIFNTVVDKMFTRTKLPEDLEQQVVSFCSMLSEPIQQKFIRDITQDQCSPDVIDQLAKKSESFARKFVRDVVKILVGQTDKDSDKRKILDCLKQVKSLSVALAGFDVLLPHLDSQMSSIVVHEIKLRIGQDQSEQVSAQLRDIVRQLPTCLSSILASQRVCFRNAQSGQYLAVSQQEGDRVVSSSQSRYPWTLEPRQGQRQAQEQGYIVRGPQGGVLSTEIARSSAVIVRQISSNQVDDAQAWSVVPKDDACYIKISQEDQYLSLASQQQAQVSDRKESQGSVWVVEQCDDVE